MEKRNRIKQTQQLIASKDSNQEDTKYKIGGISINASVGYDEAIDVIMEAYNNSLYSEDDDLY